MQCAVLTIDTTATPPERADALLVAHSAGWKRRSNSPCVNAGRSTSNSWSFPDAAGAPGRPSPGAPCGAPAGRPHPSPAAPVLPAPLARLSAGPFPDAPRRSPSVIAHQAIRMHLPLRLAASLAQRGQKPLAVFIVPEDILTLVPAVHHVIHRPRILQCAACATLRTFTNTPRQCQ